MYEIVERILTNKALPGFLPKTVTGKNRNTYTTEREPEDDILKDYRLIATLLDEVIKAIPSLSSFFISE
ncbi:MAG: hypothetical protein U5L96_17580 [Owenweeksia sp.]|nr:hypothetical protein [Owenweeksia sp.]